jgi:hypothetical protein
MTHAANLARVRDNIAATVIEFCRDKVGCTFNATYLRNQVTRRHPNIAPDSPGRILRDLRRRGLVDYVLVSRAQSLYRVVGVR